MNACEIMVQHVHQSQAKPSSQGMINTLLQVVGAVGWGNARLQIPEGTHADLSSLILRCWNEPKKRPTFGEILQYLRPLNEDIFVKPHSANEEQSVEGRSTSETESA